MTTIERRFAHQWLINQKKLETKQQEEHAESFKRKTHHRGTGGRGGTLPGL
jgi:hypothetical protein